MLTFTRFNLKNLQLSRRALPMVLALTFAVSNLAFGVTPTSAATCRAQYTVQRGDTLYKIGLKYNLTWDKIASANSLTQPNKIFAGRVLCIPTTLPAPTPAPTLTRIRFAAGAISSSVQGTLTSPARTQYVLRALQGQQMTVEIISKDNKANFAVQGVTDGQPLKRLENESRKWTGQLPSNQDYLLTVATPSGSTVYTLVITITS